MRGATWTAGRARSGGAISTHAPLAGRDSNTGAIRSKTAISTHAPLAGRDGREHRERPGAGNFNPRAPCGARRIAGLVHRFSAFDISTHAPLAGRDRKASPYGRYQTISTHAPLAGRDKLFVSVQMWYPLFQPTRPLRGATSCSCRCKCGIRYFNPRAPCGARLFPFVVYFIRPFISTHAPLAGRDARTAAMPPIATKFQPTRPLRGATVITARRAATSIFQPTRPLRGATICHSGCPPDGSYFNPRAPCGARLMQICVLLIRLLFQPTRPLRGATKRPQ